MNKQHAKRGGFGRRLKVLLCILALALPCVVGACVAVKAGYRHGYRSSLSDLVDGGTVSMSAEELRDRLVEWGTKEAWRTTRRSLLLRCTHFPVSYDPPAVATFESLSRMDSDALSEMWRNAEILRTRSVDEGSIRFLQSKTLGNLEYAYLVKHDNPDAATASSGSRLSTSWILVDADDAVIGIAWE